MLYTKYHHHHHVSWSWTVEAKYEASPDIAILCHFHRDALVITTHTLPCGVSAR